RRHGLTVAWEEVMVPTLRAVGPRRALHRTPRSRIRATPWLQEVTAKPGKRCVNVEASKTLSPGSAAAVPRPLGAGR
ncbi:hypothetical protein ACFV3B_30715, partial [Streptomyces sp. NPDC059710]